MPVVDSDNLLGSMPLSRRTDGGMWVGISCRREVTQVQSRCEVRYDFGGFDMRGGG